LFPLPPPTEYASTPPRPSRCPGIFHFDLSERAGVNEPGILAFRTANSALCRDLPLRIDQPVCRVYEAASWQFSPDGHWVAYTSNESGQSEIYVIPFPPTVNEKKWVVSTGGGVMPRWRHDGKELFFISPDWKMMAADVSTNPTFQAGTPHALFDTEMVDTGIRTGPMSWDIATDDKRFLIISDNSAGASSLNVVLNWRPEQPK